MKQAGCLAFAAASVQPQMYRERLAMKSSLNSNRVSIPVWICCVVLAAAPAMAQWTNGQDAEYVVGQPDFVTWAAATTQAGMDGCSSAAVDLTNGKLYVCDYSNNRVLRYSYPITGNTPNAELVFGQSDYVTNTANAGGRSASSLNGPSGIAVDGTGRLWVADLNNSRVVWYNAAHAIGSHKPSADGVLGQADFASGQDNRNDADPTNSVAANTLYEPAGLGVDASGTLWVADSDNNRVLRFDSAASKGNGASADGVLGQENFTSRTAVLDRDGMGEPVDCWVDGTTLWTAEVDNYRVLRFDSAASKGNGADADGVLGQPNFTSKAQPDPPTAGGFWRPWGVACDGAGRLYVCDYDNCRVLIWNNAAAKANGANADNVLGQEVFTTWNQLTTRDGMYDPSQCVIDNANGKCIVADYTNNRVLIFDASTATLPVELSGFRVE
jgi:DNA-binding beta-propeller fold protein YncE